MKTNIAIFASGTGSNARKIVEYFVQHPTICVKLICSNKPDAKVLDLCSEYDISKFYFDKQFFKDAAGMLRILREEHIDYIVLAGFLWKCPDYLISSYQNKIINIHPSLLPKYGGKGMFGYHVHEAVKANEEKESGITIHLVNEEYDKGKVIFQKKCELDENDEPDDIQKKVQILEHQFFPPVIEQFIMQFEN